jgi:hypothetical protein
MIAKPVRKPVGKSVRMPLADLGCKPLSEGVSDGFALLRSLI